MSQPPSEALPVVSDRYGAEDVSAFYEAGYWTPQTFAGLAAQQAADRPDDEFVFDGTTSLTFAEFHEQGIRLAAGFARAGLRRGDRVAVQLPNWTEFPVVALALSRIGAITVPIMPIYRGNEVGYVLQHAGAVAVVTCGEFRATDHAGMFERLRADAPEVREVYVARAEGPQVAGTALAGLFTEGDLADLEAELGEEGSPDDGFLIVYTSGTTSRPKGCFHTFNTVRASAQAIGTSLAYTSEDVQFGPSPVTHSTGLVTSILLPLVFGARSHLMEAWEPEEGLRRIERYGITGSVTATPFLQMLMGAYDPEKHDASSLRFWVCAGSPIPGSVVERSREMFAGCQTLSLYGRSENFLTTMCTVEDAPERAIASDGSALAGARVEVVDPFGEPVAAGEEGDIAYRGPSHMLEYFRDPEQTTALFTPTGFSRSGDLGRMDADGYVRVTGRLKDIIIRGGLNISAREVEDHLVAHPGVGSVAVVGMPDERLGEKVCAFVVAAPGATAPTLEEVVAFLQTRDVARQMLPERVEVVDALPMTATGKVQKHVLRADIAAKLG